MIYVVLYDEMDEPADILCAFTTREEAEAWVGDDSDTCAVIEVEVFGRAEDAYN